MSSQDLRLQHGQAEATLTDLMKEIWQGRVFVLVGAVVGALAAFAFIVLAVPHSRAEMILAPASPMNLSAANATQQAYGRPVGAAAQGPDAADSFTRFEVSYKGAAVAGVLLRDPEITKGLAADKAFSFSKPERDWTVEKLAEYIEKRVKVDPVGETALRGFSYLHPDREFAVRFLRRLHNVTDGLIRHGMRKDVNERIAYLNGAIGETLNPDNRRVITDLLMEQERLKMLVSIDQPYAASVVVPASASVKTRWPDAMLVYPAFLLIGAFLGFVAFSIWRLRADGFLRDLELLKVKQQPWFFPESGNTNEPPEAEKPLTGKKGKKKPKDPDVTEAAE